MNSSGGNASLYNLVCDIGRQAFIRWRHNGTAMPKGCSAFQQQINGPLASVTIAVGLMANSWCLAVFCQPRSPPRIYQYLIGLALWDNLLLLSAFFLHCLPTILFGCIISYGNYVYFYPYWYCLGNITLVGCVWIVLALAFDRTFALYKPILHKSLQSRRRTMAIIISISLAACIFGLPRFFEVRVEICPEDQAIGLPEIPHMAITSFRSHFVHKIPQRGTFPGVHGGRRPSLLLPGALRGPPRAHSDAHRPPPPRPPAAPETLRLPRTQLPRHAPRHQRRPPTHHPGRGVRASSLDDDTRPTSRTSAGATGAPGIVRRRSRTRGGSALLAVISTKFLLSRSLPIALDLIESVVGLQALQDKHWVIPCVTLSNYLVIINSATNLICYLICGTQFRKQSRRLLDALMCWQMRGRLQRQESGRFFDFSEATTASHSTANPSPCPSPLPPESGLRAPLNGRYSNSYASQENSSSHAKVSRSSMPSVSFDERLNRSFVYVRPSPRNLSERRPSYARRLGDVAL